MASLSQLRGFTFLALFVFIFERANGIKCYRCESTNSSNPFQCNEFLRDDVDLIPESCDDVFDAQFCVKRVGRFEGLGLECYQCTSATEWECGNGDLVKETLRPRSCDHIFEARYCIKSIGLYGGGIGTKRECSSRHLGNYCDYVQQPGDKLSYRTCIYTCTGDGCNSSTSLLPNSMFIILSSVLLISILLFQKEINISRQ